MTIPLVPLAKGPLALDSLNKAIIDVNNAILGIESVSGVTTLAALTDVVDDVPNSNLFLSGTLPSGIVTGVATNNAALGMGALVSTTTATDNTAVGDSALHKDTIGTSNTAVGSGALYNNTTGGNNTAVGFAAGATITTGSNNVCIGYVADVSSASASNRIALGEGAISTADGAAQIGSAFITDVYFGDGTAILHANGSSLAMTDSTITATTTFDTAHYLQITINGTVYHLCLAI